MTNALRGALADLPENRHTVEGGAGMRLKAAIALEAAAPGLATGRLVVVELTGEVYDEACAVLEAALAAPGRADLIVDMSRVALVSAAAAAVTVRFADLCRAQGRTLRLAGCSPAVLRALRRAESGASELECLPSVRAAFGEVQDTAPKAAVPGGGALHSAVAAVAAGERGEDARRALLSQPLIAMAQGMLCERYGLPEPADGMGLLTAAARRYHLKPRWLAAAVTRTPRPPRGSAVWFPGRRRAAPPPVTFARGQDGAALSQAEFLDALRDAACEVAATDKGDVHLVDPGSGALWLESQRGFPAGLWDRFGVVDGGGTACALAARAGERVVVDDVATDPVHEDDVRRVLLAGGSRSLQSTPVPGGGHGRPYAVFSTHHPRPHRTWTPAELAALDEIAAQAGSWLSWYRRTRLPDALEHLHQLGRAREPLPCGADVRKVNV
ncbi:GAF domain-containing protein [Streptomyces sp. NPDC096013]|uniref:GAF domain-containing protein n=1 Tax=Streptomyces sp. NPDC096013 TaxID=3366069 RepID=UPI00382542C7